jgi:hypothetical protein
LGMAAVAVAVVQGVASKAVPVALGEQAATR